MNIKGKGQRLIPEELLKYLEALKNKYPDAVDLVEANPTLEGGEDSLSSVLINGTKYAVGGSGGATLDDIVDSQGNKRFVEGTLTDGSTSASITYKKWSLSGTHLMIVLVGTVSSNLTDYQSIATLTSLPSYITSKIRPLGTSAQLVSVAKGFFIKNDQYTATEYTFNLRKSTNKYTILPAQAITISETYSFRIQFDLLIDSE